MRKVKYAVGAVVAAALLSSCAHLAQAATEQAGAPRKLNTMVTELVNADYDLYYGHGRGGYGADAEGSAGLSVEFTTPRDGWVYAATTPKDFRYGKLYVALDPVPGEPARIVHEKAGETIESMQFLPAGKHRIVLRSDLCGATVKVVARAIPELAFIKYGYHPWNSAYGPYDWAYLQKNILRDVNVVIGCGVPGEKPFVESWRAQGRRWYDEVDSVGNPAYVKVSPSAETVFKAFQEFTGVKDPAYSGVLVDEFGEFCPTPAGFDEWSRVVGMLMKYEPFKGKTLNVYAYSGNFVAQESRKRFLETLMANGARVYFERYLGESATQQAAAEGIRSALKDDLGLWEKAVPECRRNVVMALGYCNQGPMSLSFLPNVDFKVLMDMEARYLATDPAFDGLYGASFYSCGYADDECARWATRLYRHYFIEGNTASLSERYGFKYALDLIQNADLREGVKGWDIQQAEPGSVSAKELKGFGNMQGCYGGGDDAGSHYLLLKRSAKAPNVISQKISNLQPGKLYSVKCLTVDFQDIGSQSSKKQTHAVSVNVEGAAMVPEKAFTELTPGAQRFTRTLPDGRTVSEPLWVDTHFRLFRAQAPTAELRISDWADAGAPGGPLGQELMLNFVEVQPFFEE